MLYLPKSISSILHLQQSCHFPTFYLSKKLTRSSNISDSLLEATCKIESLTEHLPIYISNTLLSPSSNTPPLTFPQTESYKNLISPSQISIPIPPPHTKTVHPQYPCPPQLHQSTIPTNPNSTQSITPNPLSPSLNSYKFSKPRIYVKNIHPNSPHSQISHLCYIAQNIGPKSRTSAYNLFLDRMLQLSRPNKLQKHKNVVYLNNSTVTSSLKLLHFSVNSIQIHALLDTGSTHNLISTQTFHSIPNLTFTPVKMAMKVAGNTLQNNIIGESTLLTTFQTDSTPITLPITYFIAHTINGYQSIIGSQTLMNPQIISAITPTHIHFSEIHMHALTPLHPVTTSPSFNFLQIYTALEIPPKQCANAVIHTETPQLIPHHFTIHSHHPDITIINSKSTAHSTLNCTLFNTSNLPITIPHQLNFATLTYHTSKSSPSDPQQLHISTNSAHITTTNLHNIHNTCDISTKTTPTSF